MTTLRVLFKGEDTPVEFDLLGIVDDRSDDPFLLKVLNQDGRQYNINLHQAKWWSIEEEFDET